MFEEVGLIDTMQKQLKQAVEDFSMSIAETHYSLRIKPSTLGGECLAELWYAWHWVKKPTMTGKKARRYKKGDKEENETVVLLRNIGFHIDHIDPARIAKDRQQYKITAREGHVTGFIDGVCKHRVFTRDQFALLEAKAVNAKRFAAIQRHGIEKSEPTHYSQIQYYMEKLGLELCLYVVYNTNDDDYEFYYIPRDRAKYAILARNEEAIYSARQRPARIAQSPAFFRCKTFCNFTDICHRGEAVDINCRSCLNCLPAENGEFDCTLHGRIPSLQALLEGCKQHKPIA